MENSITELQLQKRERGGLTTPLFLSKYLGGDLRQRMKSFNIFIEQAAKKVGVGTTLSVGSRWKSLNYRYGYGLGHEEENGNGGNGNTNGNGNGNGNGVGGGGGLGESFVKLPLNIEIPNNQTEFQLGLMFRESLDENSGMLFIFDSIDYHSFHMKNTTIPLDVAFINENGIIEQISELIPLYVTPVTSHSLVRYALEVNKGWFTENNVNVGDKILNCGDN